MVFSTRGRHLAIEHLASESHQFLMALAGKLLWCARRLYAGPLCSLVLAVVNGMVMIC